MSEGTARGPRWRRAGSCGRLVGERKNLVTRARRRMLGPEQTPRRDSEQVYTLRKRVEASRGCRSCATACFLRVSRHHASRQSRAGVRFGYPRPRHTSGGASCAKMSEYVSTGAELMCRKERNSPFWGHFRTGPRMIYYLTRPLRANAGRILRAPAQGPTGMPKPASMQARKPSPTAVRMDHYRTPLTNRSDFGAESIVEGSPTTSLLLWRLQPCSQHPGILARPT